MFFWFLFASTTLIIIYSYKVHFLDGGFFEIKKTIQNNNFKKIKKCNCIFKSTFFFHMNVYDMYESENYIILIKNYNLLNKITQNLFPENYIIVINESNVEENFKKKFLKYINVSEIENTNDYIKIKGSLYTKLVFNNNFNFERKVTLTIR
jgi:hypothetical protein